MSRHLPLIPAPTWHLASYPRSGNHLVRSLIEFATHRPTLGCPGATQDAPIYQRPANARARLIDIRDADPVAFKSHFANQIQRHDQDYLIDHFLLITRDPREAISSHLARDLTRHFCLGDRTLRRRVEQELNIYIALLYAYRAYPARRRLHVRFEDLTAPPERSHPAARALLDAMGLPSAELTAAGWLQVRKIAAASQHSLGRRGQKVRARLRQAVGARIGAADVDHFLATGSWSGPLSG
ncbi:sulfotransferase family protein [Pseudodonghicola flavimaris]|uniref:Sulfotransferase family protein n=1 Tax=Pseudodonghicola flavimaris TaxID=3050036 RepID=A0ABT7F171_9RHOB|nr:hypothetical protein [Pseudodonghicola flavimaris]MDK3018358.1 hypothetical protein [Pseudodonghicola flavimaris]